jgi:hypothetical protein
MKDYGFDLEFYDKIVPPTSTKDSNLNGCHFVLCKKTLAETGWPRLINEEGDDPFIRVGDEKVSLRWHAELRNPSVWRLTTSYKWVDGNKQDQGPGNVKD